jgi:hypothetical protein
MYCAVDWAEIVLGLGAFHDWLLSWIVSFVSPFFSDYTLAVTNAAKQPPIWFPTFFLVVFQVTLGHCLKMKFVSPADCL